MKKGVILLILFILLVSPKTTSALEGTVSGEKIDTLREEIKKKVEEKLKTIMSQRKKRGWVGIIEEKTEISLKLKTGDKIRTATISEDAQIVNSKRQKINFENLKIGQKIIAMGYLQPDNNLEAKRIVVLSEKKKTESLRIIFGAISDRSEREQVLAVNPIGPAKNGNQEYEVLLDKKTRLFQRTNGKVEKINYKDLQAGQKIIAVLKPTKSNGFSFNAKLILLLSPSPTPTLAPKE